MKIECKMHRPGGTKAEIGGIEYHFAPQEDGAHVAEVDRDEHVDRFLSIPEAYKLYRGAAKQAAVANDIEAKKDVAETIHTVLLGSSVHPATFEIGGKTYTLGDVVARAQAASGLSVDGWNVLNDESRHASIDEELDKLAAEAEETGGDGNADDLADLREQFKAKFGKPPHHAMKAETIRARLAE